MSALAILITSLILFAAGYFFYARKLEKLFDINPKNSTPAVTKYDGVDFVPAKNWLVLFGHHFASIAGAGPIIGPVIACIYWGWVPALIWIIVGTIFFGAVHDFASLIISVREEGHSISDVALTCISKKAKIVFAIFIWLALILVVAVFMFLCAKTFVNEPRVIAPSLGIIPIAVLIGFLLYRLKANAFLSTALGLVLLVSLIFLGDKFVFNLGNNAIYIWIGVLAVYCYIASVLPVNILLQPRDYLSSFLLFFGLGAGILGIFIQRPQIAANTFAKFNTDQGMLWPMLFVTVACGAISGFHALISSGTSSKQISNERYAKRIGYGAMVVEGVLATLALLAICAGLKANEQTVATLRQLTPIGIFAKGYGGITKSVLGGLGGFIAIVILNAFILTTLDTATRIARYITEEVFNLKNRYFSTLIIVVVSVALAASGKWQKIWPAFGASNQLVAALALLVISCWLLAHNKTLRYTIVPAFFMLITTVAALIYQIFGFIRGKDYVLFSIALVLIGLAVFMTKEFYLILRLKKCHVKK